MLTKEDKEYMNQTYATKQDLVGLENRFALKFDDQESNFDIKMGMYHEEMRNMFQHFAEMIMGHIDKKFEVVVRHSKRLDAPEKGVADLRVERMLHEKWLDRLEGK